jgi:hypothetical protein
MPGLAIRDWNTPMFRSAAEPVTQRRSKAEIGTSSAIRNLTCSAKRKSVRSAAAWNLGMFHPWLVGGSAPASAGKSRQAPASAGKRR